MITEVYINDKLIDISDEETVAASYGNISFGEFQKRKGVKTNTWTAPFSPRNKDVLESCEVVGSYSLIPYRKSTIRVDIHGVTVFEGFCTITEAKEVYKIQAFAGASDFYNLINGRKLTALDLSEFTHFWGETNQRGSWNNTKGFIYAYVYDGRTFQTEVGSGVFETNLPPEFFLPHIFFHSVIRQIATDAGYQLTGNVLTNERFLKHIILCNKFPMPVIYGGEIILQKLLPDLSQSKLWLDFANIYGLQFDVDDVNKIIRCDYIDDLIFNEPDEWTDKVDRSEKFEKKYSLGFGQKSYLRFATDDVCTLDYAKEIIIDDTTLDEEIDVYKSQFFLIQFIAPGFFANGVSGSFTFTIKSGSLFRGSWDVATIYSNTSDVKQFIWHNGTYYVTTADSTGEEPPNASFWKVVAEKDIWDTKSRPMYGHLVTEPFSPVSVIFPGGQEQVTKVISNIKLDWTNSYSLHYKVFNRIIDRTKKVEGLIKLSYADVNQLNFTKLKRIDNELYLLEEVKQFKMNRKDSTFCDMIRL